MMWDKDLDCPCPVSQIARVKKYTSAARLQAFFDKVDKQSDGCWCWTGSLKETGYAQFYDGTKVVRAHRWAYEQLTGPIPEGRHLDHTCRVRHCVNPDHLEPVTKRENERRGLKGELKTHCTKGHEYTEENTYRYKNGHRRCRQCRREQMARYKIEGRSYTTAEASNARVRKHRSRQQDDG